MTTLGAASMRNTGFFQKIFSGGGGNGGGGGSSGLYDDLFNTNVLMIHGNGANGASNNTFLDGSTNALTVTRNGTATQGTFSPFSQTGWGNYFNGSTDYLSLSSAVANNMGSGTSSNYTIECWVFLNVLPSGSPYYNNQYTILAGIAGSNGIYHLWGISSTGYYTIDRAGNTYYNITGTIPTAGTWNHVAFVNTGTTLVVYLNGTSVASRSLTGTWYTSCAATYIGYNGYAGSYFNGYISNLRVTTNVVYTDTFTPSTTPLTAVTGTILLTCQNNRFVDNSASSYALTISGTPKVQAFSPFVPVSTAAYSTSSVGGSVYFNGSSDYLSITSGSLLNLSSSNNWTLEAWIYPTATLSNYMHIFFGSGISLGSYSGTLIVTNNSVQLISGGTLTLNTWHHIALVNVASTSYNLYLNGARTATSSAASFSSSTTYIGGNSSGGQLWPGYISQARITNTAVYTGTSYTIPAAPLTAITGTQLLLSGTNAAILDQTAKNDILAVGSAQLSTSQYKFGTASMYFNGTTDYITMPTTVNLQLGTGNFTIETWSYLTSRASSYPCIFGNYNSFTTGALSIFAGHGSSSSTAYQVAYNGSFPAISGGTITYNTWNHIALVRNSGTLTLYINGVVTGTPVTGATAALNGVGSVTYIGTAGDSISGGYIAGYLDDFRISKYARYTSAFTPTAVEFGDTGSSGSGGGGNGGYPTTTGGTMSNSGSYTIHTFTSSGTFVTDSSLTIEYLVVAGGGGGSDSNGGGGGGGAGGMLTASSYSLPIGTYTVTVGSGGAGAVGIALGSSGANSSISGSGITTITATGGGRGGDYLTNGANGGSGGGGSYGASAGTGVAGQGNDGGAGATWSGGGGGGKGSAGVNAGSQTYGGAGGSAATSSISGTTVYYAGGGGGGTYSGSSGSGGLGGGTATTAQKGGAGDGKKAAKGDNATANTGGGGGGGSDGAGGGTGGSGIIIIRYTGGAPLTVPTGGTKTTSGSYTYHTFTTSDTITFPNAISVDYLVVAGGGGGGGWSGGGGGAGGVLSANSYSVSAGTTFTVTIGSGGTGAPTGTYTAANWSSGSNTTVVNGGTTIASATGGGAGATYNISPSGSVNGGSGGGASYLTAAGTGTAGPPRQGYDGSSYGGSGSAYYGGGGGGASAAGSNSNGGAGIEWPAGSGTYYAGGGAASLGVSGGSAGTGGSGGGGNGVSSSVVAGSGTANTGGGGAGARTPGGAGTSQTGGGAGGSGVVIFRYLT